MLKTIQWKLVLMFVLLVMALMMVFGTFLQARITVFYHNNFINEMALAFSDELSADLNAAAGSENPVENLKDTLVTYSGRLGINTDRGYYVLDKKDGAFLAGSVNYTDIEKSDNIIAAMSGKTGNSSSLDMTYLDYAWPTGGYIVYIRDTKQEMLNLIHTVLGIIAQALLIGILISIGLGFIMSRTITKPIADLTKNAEGLAEGKYDVAIEVKSNDEIGQLARTFNYMSSMIKHSLDEIAQEKNKLETVFRYMTDGVMAFNVNQAVIHINPEAKSMFNIRDEAEIKFDSFFESVGANICMAELLYLDHYSTIERNIDMSDKHFKAFFATFKVDNDKTSGGVVVVVQDVTENQNLEISRREFVANVSHELRTPLTTIKSYAETLYDGCSNQEEKHFLGVIGREVDRMTRIVKELLMLSSIDHKKITIMKTRFSLDMLISEVVEKMSMDAKKYNQTLTYTKSSEIPPVMADIDRIEQVITNIISNAIKYTPENGKIEVFAGYLYNEAYIKIRDNGMGIPKEDLPKVFDRFYRVDKARSREKGGTGLGLSIANEMIRLHGGTIKINSMLGKGTEVIIKLPIDYNED